MQTAEVGCPRGKTEARAPAKEGGLIKRGGLTGSGMVGLAVCLIALTLALTFPGSMLQDSMYALREALTIPAGQMTDWYAPAYSFAWKGMIRAAGALGAPPMLQIATMTILQVSLSIAGIVILIYRRGRSKWRSILAIVAVWIFPPLLAYFGMLWRDVMMGALLLLAVCCLDAFQRTRRGATAAGALSLIFLACLTRHNCIAAALPLLIWLGSMLFERRVTVAAFAGGAAILMVGGAMAVNVALTNDHYGAVLSSPMLYDLMGISARTGKLVIPESAMQPGYSFASLKVHYRDDYNDLEGLKIASTPALLKTTRNAWVSAVANHPLAFLEHREYFSARWLGISGAPHVPFWYGIPAVIYPNYFSDRRYWVTFPENSARAIFRRYLDLSEYVFFRLWAYLLVLIGVVLIERRKRGTAFWLSLSGLLYLCSGFLILPSADFRYGYWSVLAAVVSIAIVATARHSESDNKVTIWKAHLQRKRLKNSATFRTGC